MPDIAAVLKGEISRLSRKEARASAEGLAKASRACRSDLAALKRRVHELERLVGRLSSATGGGGVAKIQPDQAEANLGTFRFSSKGLASHRQRLGLSAADLGRLVGASGATVSKWEQGTARPGARHVQQIAAVRRMGKRAAIELLQQAAR